jgi:hypothetical protein
MADLGHEPTVRIADRQTASGWLLPLNIGGLGTANADPVIARVFP